ncbi:MAG: type I-MYXAN CRISPR-associated protein Cas6/Cmx6 [Cocleimonas sp.]
MFWEEDEDKTLPYNVPEDVIDVLYSIQCKRLTIDHAWALSQAILKELPWLEEEDNSGIHQIHVAESNNGWLRPENEDGALLYPSKRTKFTLRIPGGKLDAAKKLTGRTLDINGHELTIGESKKKNLVNSSVIFARYVATDENEDENDFLIRIHKEIKNKTGINAKKMLCGKSQIIKTPDLKLLTRHLMIADLDSDPSIRIQQTGLGKYRKLGCGIFLPHKGIKTLKPTE